MTWTMARVRVFARQWDEHRAARRRLLETRLEAIAFLRGRGLSIMEVAAELDDDLSTVARLCRKHGIKKGMKLAPSEMRK